MSVEPTSVRHSLDALRAAGVCIKPIEWEMVYPVQPSAPIGRIRRRRDGFHAKFEDELLGIFPRGDRAAEGVWQRFLDASAPQHAHASVTHE